MSPEMAKRIVSPRGHQNVEVRHCLTSPRQGLPDLSDPEDEKNASALFKM
jgi:hypothetical protein